ncbi:hypothetical protein ACP70R_032645 [Stipagrostis hirtigluma subsp. patula]
MSFRPTRSLRPPPPVVSLLIIDLLCSRDEVCRAILDAGKSSASSR